MAGKNIVAAYKIIDTYAQRLHFMGGSIAVAYPAHWFGIHSMFWTVPITLVACAIKEFWYDYKYESKILRGSSAKDFSYYTLGVIAGIGCALL